MSYEIYSCQRTTNHAEHKTNICPLASYDVIPEKTTIPKIEDEIAAISKARLYHTNPNQTGLNQTRQLLWIGTPKQDTSDFFKMVGKICHQTHFIGKFDAKNISSYLVSFDIPNKGSISYHLEADIFDDTDPDLLNSSATDICSYDNLKSAGLDDTTIMQQNTKPYLMVVNLNCIKNKMCDTLTKIIEIAHENSWDLLVYGKHHYNPKTLLFKDNLKFDTAEKPKLARLRRRFFELLDPSLSFNKLTENTSTISNLFTSKEDASKIKKMFEEEINSKIHAIKLLRAESYRLNKNTECVYVKCSILKELEEKYGEAFNFEEKFSLDKLDTLKLCDIHHIENALDFILEYNHLSEAKAREEIIKKIESILESSAHSKKMWPIKKMIKTQYEATTLESGSFDYASFRLLDLYKITNDLDFLEKYEHLPTENFLNSINLYSITNKENQWLLEKAYLTLLATKQNPGKMLIFYGRAGIGKTFLTMAMLKIFLKQGHNIRIVNQANGIITKINKGNGKCKQGKKIIVFEDFTPYFFGNFEEKVNLSNLNKYTDNRFKRNKLINFYLKTIINAHETGSLVIITSNFSPETIKNCTCKSLSDAEKERFNRRWEDLTKENIQYYPKPNDIDQKFVEEHPGINRENEHSSLDNFVISGKEDLANKQRALLEKIESVVHGSHPGYIARIVLLLGDAGTGKTHLAVALAKLLWEKHKYRVRIITPSNIGDQKCKVHTVNNIKMLCLADDCTDEKPTVYILDDLNEENPRFAKIAQRLIKSAILKNNIVIVTGNQKPNHKTVKLKITNTSSLKIVEEIKKFQQSFTILLKVQRDKLAQRGKIKLAVSFGNHSKWHGIADGILPKNISEFLSSINIPDKQVFDLVTPVENDTSQYLTSLTMQSSSEICMSNDALSCLLEKISRAIPSLHDVLMIHEFASQYNLMSYFKLIKNNDIYAKLITLLNFAKHDKKENTWYTVMDEILNYYPKKLINAIFEEYKNKSHKNHKAYNSIKNDWLFLIDNPQLPIKHFCANFSDFMMSSVFAKVNLRVKHDSFNNKLCNVEQFKVTMENITSIFPKIKTFPLIQNENTKPLPLLIFNNHYFLIASAKLFWKAKFDIFFVTANTVPNDIRWENQPTFIITDTSFSEEHFCDLISKSRKHGCSIFISQEAYDKRIKTILSKHKISPTEILPIEMCKNQSQQIMGTQEDCDNKILTQEIATIKDFCNDKFKQKIPRGAKTLHQPKSQNKTHINVEHIKEQKSVCFSDTCKNKSNDEIVNYISSTIKKINTENSTPELNTFLNSITSIKDAILITQMMHIKLLEELSPSTTDSSPNKKYHLGTSLHHKIAQKIKEKICGLIKKLDNQKLDDMLHQLSPKRKEIFKNLLKLEESSTPEQTIIEQNHQTLIANNPFLLYNAHTKKMQNETETVQDLIFNIHDLTNKKT